MLPHHAATLRRLGCRRPDARAREAHRRMSPTDRIGRPGTARPITTSRVVRVYLSPVTDASNGSGEVVVLLGG